MVVDKWLEGKSKVKNQNAKNDLAQLRCYVVEKELAGSEMSGERDL